MKKPLFTEPRPSGSGTARRLGSCLLLLSICASLFARSKELSKGSAFNDRVQFTYSTMLEPSVPGQTVSIGGGMYVDAGFHRFLMDKKQKKYFGYDIQIEPDSQDQFRVTIQPLSPSAAKLGLEPSGDWTLVPLPRVPPPQTVPNGGGIVLELMVNPSTGQKIVDYLTIQGEQRNVETSSRPARDFTVEDASLALMQPRVTVNGQLVPDSAEMRGGAIGPVLFFHLPKRGRFALSLAPNEAYGFHRAGEVRGSNLTITWGPDKFVFNCNGRIAPGRPHGYHVYVRHDPDIERGSGFVLGATSPAMLLRR